MRTKLLQLKSWLLPLLMIMGAGSVWAETTYKLVQVTSVEAGGLYVFEQAGRVMGNEINSSNALLTVSSYSTRRLTGTEAYVWTLETAKGGFYMKNVSIGMYLNNKSGADVSLDKSKASIWEYTFGGDCTCFIQNTSNSTVNGNRFLGLLSSSNTYKALANTSSNLTGYPHAIVVYQLIEEKNIPVESVSLNETSALLKVGDELQLTATVLPEEVTDKSVTWASSDEDVAMVDDGYVLATGAGTATITVTTNDGGMTATCEITVSERTEPMIALSDTSLDFGEVEIGETQSLTFTVTPANLASDLTITVDNAKYTVSPGMIAQDATVAQTITVTAAPTMLSDDMTGLITIRGGGLAEEYIVDLTTTVVGKNPNLIVKDPFEIEVTTEKLLDELYITASDGEVSITVSDETIAKIEDGMLKGIKPGKVILTVKVAATTVYAEASEDIPVTVTTKPAVQPVGSELGSYYALVTDAAILTSGDKVLIVNKDAEKAMSTEQKTNNRGSADVTISGDNKIVEISSDVQEITLEEYNSGWCFNVGNGYLYAASSSANHLKTQSTKNSNAKAKIEINDVGVATIKFQGTYTHDWLRYNSSSKLFACYEKGQDDVSLYRYNWKMSCNVHIGATGWRTLVSAKDVNVPAECRAYIVTTNDGVTASLTAVKNIKNNTPVLLQGPANSDCTLALTNETVDYPSENLLQISTETTGNGVYVLANKSRGVGFYLWTGGALGAGRVYLTLPVDGNVREFISFGMDDETAIETVAVQQTTTGIFDLQGRRVVKPAAGLYIVNGRKVFIK
ncbi:MAG: Ig-like domain-containing protein [Bacteroidaceae bacterium]|nr:Ig-like domain-containing protein [Bacteroidaceae bacterium]